MTRAHVITGSFGAGKTTAIRRLMADKPAEEFWVVILNEFTEAGIDVLTVAQAARGAADVRLVAGGCLCCVGELEFGTQLRDILRTRKPARLLIEPSGAGHAADIVDELAAHEARHELRLDSVICLVDALDAQRILRTREPGEWSQIQSADVLLLSKPDLAAAADRQAFAGIVAEQFPVKQFIGECRAGALPPEALQLYARAPAFSSRATDAAEAPQTIEWAIAGSRAAETRLRSLGRWAVTWTVPADVAFSRHDLQPGLEWLLEAHGTWLRRLKGVFRTGPGPSLLVQSHGRGLAMEDTAYRRDSRLEIVLDAEPTQPFLENWRTLLRDGAVRPAARLRDP